MRMTVYGFIIIGALLLVLFFSIRKASKNKKTGKSINVSPKAKPILYVIMVIEILNLVIIFFSFRFSIYSGELPYYIEYIVYGYLVICLLIYSFANQSMRKEERKIGLGVLLVLFGGWIIGILYFVYFVVASKDTNYSKQQIDNSSTKTSYSKEDKINCPNCFRLISASSAFCTYCGKRIEMKKVEMITCPVCFRSNPDTATYCSYCGGRLDSNSLASKNG